MSTNVEERTAAMTTVATLLEVPYSTLHGMSKRDLVDTTRKEGDLHVVLNESLKEAIDNYRPRGSVPVAKEINLDRFIGSRWEQDALIYVAEWKSKAISWDFLSGLYGMHEEAFYELDDEYVSLYYNNESEKTVYIKLDQNAFDQVFGLYHGEWEPEQETVEPEPVWKWSYLPWVVFGLILISTLIYFAVS